MIWLQEVPDPAETIAGLTDSVQDLTGLGPDLQANLLKTITVIVVLWLLRWLTLRIVWGQTEDVRARYRWRKIVTYTAVVLGILLVGRVWFDGFSDIATYLGLVSAGLAIALRDLITNIAGWLFIVWRRPFVVGDRIQVGDDAGDVIDQRVFQFTLLEIGNWVAADQSTGRIIHVPNGKVFTENIGNYTRGFRYIWHEIPVLVTFESDWRRAKQILQDVASQHAEELSEQAQQRIIQASRRFMIFYSTLTPTVYTRVEDSGVLLTIRYLTEPRNRRGSEQAMWEEILDRFEAVPEIDFAYPTRRFYDNVVEGKPPLRPAGPE